MFGEKAVHLVANAIANVVAHVGHPALPAKQPPEQLVASVTLGAVLTTEPLDTGAREENRGFMRRFALPIP